MHYSECLRRPTPIKAIEMTHCVIFIGVKLPRLLHPPHFWTSIVSGSLAEERPASLPDRKCPRRVATRTIATSSVRRS
jgi:hypothetical protein